MGGRGWKGLQGGREIEGGSGAGCSAVLRRAWVVGGVGRFGRPTRTGPRSSK